MLNWRFVLIFLLFIGSAYSDEEAIQRRVQAFMILGDEREAFRELTLGLKQYPDSNHLVKLEIELLAVLGNEKAMLHAWNAYEKKHPNDQLILEKMAWGMIRKGASSSSPMTRALSLLAAQFGNDARGVKLLQRAMKNEDCVVKGMAVELASNFRDDLLIDEMLRLLKSEKHGVVRVGVIKALGKMKIKKAQGALESILDSKEASPEMRAAALESLVQLHEKSDVSKVKLLASSDRAVLRQLACQLIPFCKEEVPEKIMKNLLMDSNGDVRGLALQMAPVFENRQRYHSQYVAQLHDPNPFVAISSAFALTLSDPESGGGRLECFLNSPRREVRLMASGALALTGKYGLPWMLRNYQTNKDPLVRMNLAMGLIGQRADVEGAVQVVCDGLDTFKERLMWKEKGLFRYLAPTEISYKVEIPHYPEGMDHLVRLEVLNSVAKLHVGKVQEAIKSFLKNRSWGVSGLAAMLLVSEGDEEALEMVRSLLQDPDKNIRIQAALVLGHWGRDPSVVKMLEESYPGADRQMKERILEALARIGSRDSVPFLVNHLSDSSQNLRVIAAAALVLCLNH